MSSRRPLTPPESFPEPFPERRRTQNAVGGNPHHLQAGPPPGNTHDPRVPSPSSAYTPLPQSSLQQRPRPPPPIHRATHPSLNVTAPPPQPTYRDEYASHRPAPQPPSGSFSHHSPSPVPAIPSRQPATNFSGSQQPMFSHSTAISTNVPSNLNTTMPYYDSSPPNSAYLPSHPEMPREPQNYLDLHEREYDSSDEDAEQGPEGASNSSGYIRGRAPLKSFFATPLRPQPQSRASASGPSELPCKFCGYLSPRREVERLGGFCSDKHKWDWGKMEFPCGLCKCLSPRSVLERWDGFCSERHKCDWEKMEFPCRLCKRLSRRSVLERWDGFCSERHKWDSENPP